MRVMRDDLIGAHERRCCDIHGCVFTKDDSFDRMFDHDTFECRVEMRVTKQAHDSCVECSAHAFAMMHPDIVH